MKAKTYSKPTLQRAQALAAVTALQAKPISGQFLRLPT